MPEDVLLLNIMDAVHKSGAKPVVLWLLGWVQQSFYLEVFQDLCDNFLPPLPGAYQDDHQDYHQDDHQDYHQDDHQDYHQDDHQDYHQDGGPAA